MQLFFYLTWSRQVGTFLTHMEFWWLKLSPRTLTLPTNVLKCWIFCISFSFYGCKMTAKSLGLLFLHNSINEAKRGKCSKKKCVYQREPCFFGAVFLISYPRLSRHLVFSDLSWIFWTPCPCSEYNQEETNVYLKISVSVVKDTICFQGRRVYKNGGRIRMLVAA